MDEAMKRILNILLIILGCIALLVLLVFIFLCLKYLINQYLTPNSNANWIGFIGNIFGAILSGCITLLIFILTMRRNRKIDDKKKIEAIRPFLTIGTYIKRPDGITPKKFVYIKNIGLNSAIKILCPLNIRFNKNENCIETLIINNKPFEGELYPIGSLAINDTIEIKYDQFEKEFLTGDSIEFLFYFFDLYNNKYEQFVTLTKDGVATGHSIPQLFK
jgi:uncharacterized membrane protein